MGGKTKLAVQGKGDLLSADVRMKRTIFSRRPPQGTKVADGEKSVSPVGSRKRGVEEGSDGREDQKRTRYQEEFAEVGMEELSEMAGLREQLG